MRHRCTGAAVRRGEAPDCSPGVEHPRNGMDAVFVSLQHDTARLTLIINRAPAWALASRLVPVRSQHTPVIPIPATAAPARRWTTLSSAVATGESGQLLHADGVN